MKRIITSIILLCASAIALAQATSTTPAALRMGQNIEALTPGGPSTGNTNRFIAVPDTGVTCLLTFSGTTRLPACPTVGAGLSIVNGVLTASQAQADWSLVTGPGAILNKPALATVAYTADYADLFNKPALGTAASASVPSSGNAAGGQVVLGADTRLADSRAPLAHTQAWSTITSTPTTQAGYGITDGVTSGQLTTALAGYATSASLSGYATTSALTSGLASKFNTPAGATSQYVRGDGSLATLPAATAFNFSQPTARTLAVSTSYQALDTTKAAIIVPSYACQNSTTVLASSACTVQVRMGTGTLTCATGTVYYTQSLTVGLGLLLTQSSTNPVPINLPIGASFILCPTAGTFTITAVEQSAG